MNLIKSTGTFGFYTIISRLLGYLRDVLIAIFLGTSFLADVFFVAFRIPNTFRRLFAEGTFNAAFIPSYTSELVKKKSGSQKFANEIFNLLFLGLLFLVLIIEIFMPVFVRLIAPGFVDNSEKIQLAVNLTRITMPFLMFVSLSSFFAAILNSHNKFAAASAAPIILNIVLIGILFFGKFLNDELVYSGTKKVTDRIKNSPLNAGKLVLSPTRTYAPLIKKIFEEIERKKINGIIHCSGGAQTKILHFVDKLHIIKDNLFDLPPVFKLIQQESGTSWKEMYQVFNMGHRMEIYTDRSTADKIINISNRFNIEAKIIGRVEDSKNKKLTISSSYGTFEY